MTDYVRKTNFKLAWIIDTDIDDRLIDDRDIDIDISSSTLLTNASVLRNPNPHP